MIAVLFNTGNVRLGEVRMPHECRLILFGGGHFVRTETVARTESGEPGVAFEMSDRYVKLDLDDFCPREAVPGDRI